MFLYKNINTVLSDPPYDDIPDDSSSVSEVKKFKLFFLYLEIKSMRCLNINNFNAFSRVLGPQKIRKILLKLKNQVKISAK